MPPFEKCPHRKGCGMTIFLSFAFERIKIVLFIKLLLNHILYPTLARTPYQAWQAIGKNSGLPLHPLPLFGEKGKGYFFFGGGFPGYSRMLTTEKVFLRRAELLVCGYPLTVICASFGSFSAIPLVCLWNVAM